MKAAPYNMLLEAASRYNILTLTTNCAAACVFCSHHQNPKEIEAFYINKLTLEEAKGLVEFLDEEAKVTIGESATRICEGEPFAFEYILDILKLIRHKYPNMGIQITTSGIYLEEKLLQDLQRLQHVELNISLNSCTEEGRKKLYGGKAHMQAVTVIKLLKNYDIKFNGSIVAMPHILGWENIEETIRYLANEGAETIRVFVPGYTRYTKIALPETNVGQCLQAIADRLAEEVKTPIIVEPAEIDSLDAIVEGVIQDTPAYQAGIKRGDRLVSINGREVYSRVDAYHKLFEAESPEIFIEKQGQMIRCILEKNKNTKTGLVFNYDIAPDTAKRIINTVEKFTSKKALVLTSELGYGIMTKLLAAHEMLAIKIARNNYFGGNIKCAGLLVLEDIEAELAQDNLPQVLFLPQIMFDEKGRDLTGRHYLELEQKYHISIIVL